MNLKSVLIFASGLAIGGVVGFRKAGNFYKKVMADEINERVEALTKHETAVNILDEDQLQEDDMPDAEMYKPEGKPVEETKTDSKFKPRGSFATDYSAMYEHPLDDDEMEEIEKIDNWRNAEDSLKHNEMSPVVIPKTQFGELANFNQVYMTYYTGSETFVVDGDSPQVFEAKDLDEIRSMLGDAIEQCGFKDSDDEEICIRNFARGTDFSIVKAENFEDEN